MWLHVATLFYVALPCAVHMVHTWPHRLARVPMCQPDPVRHMRVVVRAACVDWLRRSGGRCGVTAPTTSRHGTTRSGARWGCGAKQQARLRAQSHARDAGMLLSATRPWRRARFRYSGIAAATATAGGGCGCGCSSMAGLARFKRREGRTGTARKVASRITEGRRRRWMPTRGELTLQRRRWTPLLRLLGDDGGSDSSDFSSTRQLLQRGLLLFSLPSLLPSLLSPSPFSSSLPSSPSLYLWQCWGEAPRLGMSGRGLPDGAIYSPRLGLRL